MRKIDALHPDALILSHNPKEDIVLQNLNLPVENDVTKDHLTELIFTLPKQFSSGLLGWTNEFIQFLYLGNRDNEAQLTF